MFAGRLLIADAELSEAFPRDCEISARELLLKTKMLAKTLSVSFEASARRVTEHLGRSAIVRIRVNHGTLTTFVIQWATESEHWLQSGRGKRITPEHLLFELVSREWAEQQPLIREAHLPPFVAVASQWTPVHLDLAARFGANDLGLNYESPFPSDRLGLKNVDSAGAPVGYGSSN
jgi:hypothetical protein